MGFPFFSPASSCSKCMDSTRRDAPRPWQLKASAWKWKTRAQKEFAVTGQRTQSAPTWNQQSREQTDCWWCKARFEHWAQQELPWSATQKPLQNRWKTGEHTLFECRKKNARKKSQYHQHFITLYSFDKHFLHFLLCFNNACRLVFRIQRTTNAVRCKRSHCKHQAHDYFDLSKAKASTKKPTLRDWKCTPPINPEKR